MQSVAWCGLWVTGWFSETTWKLHISMLMGCHEKVCYCVEVDTQLDALEQIQYLQARKTHYTMEVYDLRCFNVKTRLYRRSPCLFVWKIRRLHKALKEAHLISVFFYSSDTCTQGHKRCWIKRSSKLEKKTMHVDQKQEKVDLRGICSLKHKCKVL